MCITNLVHLKTSETILIKHYNCLVKKTKLIHCKLFAILNSVCLEISEQTLLKVSKQFVCLSIAKD